MSAFDKDNEPYTGPDLQRYIERVLEVERPPPGGSLHTSWKVMKPLVNPVIRGSDNIPDRPCLFIGNHALFAIDGMVLMPLMLWELNRFLRPMGDKFLWNSRTEPTLLKTGGVIGNPEVCTALMDAGEDILVFPGGAHEAVKPKSESYTLQWKNRFGFVRLAALHGYTIVPFAMVGPEEFYDHIIEGHELPHSALGKLLKRAGLLTEDTRPDMLPPVPRGMLGSLLPRPQRCYVSYGEPVDLSRHRGKIPGKKALGTIRDRVATSIEDQIADLLLLRQQRRGEDGLLRRILSF